MPDRKMRPGYHIDELDPVIGDVLGYADGDADPYARIAEDGELVPESAEEINHKQGRWGTCYWSIGPDGTLRVGPGSVERRGGVPWRPWKQSIRAVELDDGSHVTGDMSFLFDGCANLKTANLSRLDASDVRDASWLFANCTALETVALPHDLGSLERATGAFSGCARLSRITGSGSLELPRLARAPMAFDGCASLTGAEALQGALDQRCAETQRAHAAAERRKAAKTAPSRAARGFKTYRVPAPPPVPQAPSRAAVTAGARAANMR